MTQGAIGGLLVAVGTIVLFIAAWFPAKLAYVPGLRWGGAWGPRASRFGSAVGAGTSILFGLELRGEIPQSAKGAVLVVWGAVVIAAAVHDIAIAIDTIGAKDPEPAARKPGKRKSRKRRK